MIRNRVIVRGRVQGVGFRYTARIEAERLGVTGFVSNQADGSVLAEAEGDPAAVEQLVTWLGIGPGGARVDGVVVAAIEPEGSTAFTIR